MGFLRPASAQSITAALADVASFSSFFSITVSDDDAGWHPIEEDYARGFPDLITRTTARYDTREQRIGASIVQLGHAARLWSPMLACAVVHGVVPDLTPLHRADDGPALRLPTPSGRHVEGNAHAELIHVLYRAVVVTHLEALAAGLRVKVAPRLLYGNAASALAEAGRAVLAARPDLAEPARRLTTDLLVTGRLAGLGDVTGPDLTFRRRTCCLYYRVPGGVKCGDCSLDGKQI
ncbi:(2Fe-2S)-binding protein [Sphaerisporangium sp. NPDC051011]|uniref:(2Fe-2S)-binding protein n=1 Tax=Sphaerisporangium sp. NPDC051011 TaxID=3155792 RepID=UPI00340E3E06